MTDNVTKAKRSHIMSRIRGKNTGPELRLKKVLKPLHFTYQPKGIYGRPDFANRKKRIAIFVDGCFWHGCMKHFTKPQSNIEFWELKISRNIKHDREVSNKLRKNGWRVVRIWEHEIKRNPDKVPVRLLRYLKTRRT